MPRANSPRFTMEVFLDAQPYQKDILEKRFEAARQLYNELLAATWRRYVEMTKTLEYRLLMVQLEGCAADDRKIVIDSLREIRVRFGINENAFQTEIIEMRKRHKKHIDSQTAQKLATRLFTAFTDLVFGKGKSIHYKKHGSIKSLESKANETGIRYKDGNFVWGKLKIPAIIDHCNPYETSAMENEIAFCRIVRKQIRGKTQYYLHIVFKGCPPPKISKETGELTRRLGHGDVGLDIGTQTIAISGESDVKLLELADRVQHFDAQIQSMQGVMERSRRATNPDNYNPDGSVKKQGQERMVWQKSKRYLRLEQELHELFRKQAAVRRQQHHELSNEILGIGDKVYVEKMSFEGLQRCAVGTTMLFRKSIALKGPSALLRILDNKLRFQKTQLNFIDTYAVKASQYNHFDESYTKKKLCQRWNNINGDKVQRDMYSAFLIMNVGDDLRSIDRDKCIVRYKKFLALHNVEVQRLKCKNNLISMGIM